jgi:hypothetical protein
MPKISWEEQPTTPYDQAPTISKQAFTMKALLMYKYRYHLNLICIFDKLKFEHFLAFCTRQVFILLKK